MGLDTKIYCNHSLAIPNNSNQFPALHPCLKGNPRAFTGPYGRAGKVALHYYHYHFETLEEVVEHYNSGIQNHPTLSPALTDDNGNPVQLNLMDSEKAALVSFLKTLTDSSMESEEKWINPFE